MGESFFTSFFLIFSGAAVLATMALYTRQPYRAFIAIGVLLGPSATSLISDPTLIRGGGNRHHFPALPARPGHAASQV